MENFNTFTTLTVYAHKRNQKGEKSVNLALYLYTHIHGLFCRRGTLILGGSCLTIDILLLSGQRGGCRASKAAGWQCGI